jgi:hypothetical protein
LHRACAPNPASYSNGGLKRIQDHHREIARLAGAGYNVRQIATHVGLEPASVYSALSNPLMQEAVAVLRSKRDDIVLEGRKVLENHAEQMCHALADIAIDPNVRVENRLKAIDSALDRAGVSRITKSERTSMERKFTSIEHIKKLASATVVDNPNIVCVEAVTELPESNGCQQLSLIDSLADTADLGEPLDAPL